MSAGTAPTPRVLLIRIGAIGNALVSVPAIRGLRKAWPDAYLCLVGDPLTLELLQPSPYLDETISYDNKGPQKAGPGYARFIRELRKRRFTHAVHFRRYLRSELMGFLSGAPVRVGFATEARLQLLNRKVEYRQGENVIELNLELVRALGVDAHDRRLECWPAGESDRVEALIDKACGSGPLVVIHPAGATQREQLWPGFGELAGMLKKELDARVIMIGAPSEKELVEKTASSARVPAAIGFPLNEVALLIQKADLFCGTDSGPAHIADAVHTPGGIIYAPHKRLDRQLKKWKPEGEDYLAFTPETDCNSCPRETCTTEDKRRCAASIPAPRVCKGLKELHERRKASAGCG
ncbi:MAG: glycosyltransferase family 9 protein [bacterium]